MAKTATITEEGMATQLENGKQQDLRTKQEKQKTADSIMNLAKGGGFGGLKQAMGALPTIGKEGSKQLLAWAWRTVLVSYGLTLLYIMVHFWLSIAWPEYVCKLGEEGLFGLTPVGKLSKNIPGAHTAANIAETIVVAFLHLILILILLIPLTLIGFIGWIHENPISAARNLGLGVIWEFITRIITGATTTSS